MIKSFLKNLQRFDFNQTPETEEEIRRFIRSVPISWYQQIELPYGLKTPGRNSKKKFELAQIGAAVKGKKILDIGCNTGAFCFYAEENQAEEIQGIDIDLNMIKTAQIIGRIKNSCAIFHNMDVADALEMFGEKRFDITFAFAVLHKITNSENQWSILTNPSYLHDRQLQEETLKSIIRMTKEKVFLELTYRYKGYKTRKENYPEYEDIGPIFFAEKYQNKEYFSAIRIVGDAGGEKKWGGRRRIIYHCEI